MKSRREALGNLALGSALLGGSGCLSPEAFRSQTNNPIVRENQRKGTREWLLTHARIAPATRYRSPWIEGYASKRSVRPGESIDFFVSTRPESAFTMDVYRMGFYGGDGGRLMARLGEFEGIAQALPPVGLNRVRDCQWTSCKSLTIPEDWLSGVYLVKLSSLKGGEQSYIIFLVRDDRKADYLFQCSDNTWQAYNRWPDQYSLYDDGRREWYWGGGVEVSFNRPYSKYCQILDAPLSLGSGEWFLWEYPMAYWLEAQGRDITYISNLDTHTDPQGLRRARGFLSVGHDEYYSLSMYRHLEAAIQEGLNVAFFSGNSVCGRIEFSPDQTGKSDRNFERVGVFGPPGGTREFEAMSSLIHERPYANELIGAHSTGPVTGGADWICRLPDHWIFEGTGMTPGEAIPGLVGWEWHGDPASIAGLEIVASGPTQSSPGSPNGGFFTATTYPGPRGNFVFNASTCWWADGLAEPPGYLRPSVYTSPLGPDRRVQQITSNVLDRMLQN